MVYQDLDTLLGRRSDEHEHLSRRAPFVRTTPPSILSGTVGLQRVVTLGQTVQFCKWQGDDGDVVPVTITVAPVNNILPNPGNNNLLRPYATIQFGSKDALPSVEVDLNTGFQMTVGASAVTVLVTLPADPSAAAGQTSSLTFAGMLSFQPCVRVTPISRTIQATAASPLSIQLPAFAKDVLVYKTLLADVATVSFFDSEGSTLAEFSSPAGSQITVPLRIPGGAFYISVQDGGTPVAAALVFGLAV